MNRFLSGLIDRAEGRAPVLQRRTRALFEPQQPGGARPSESLEFDDTQAPAREATRGERRSDVDVPRRPARVELPQPAVGSHDATTVRPSDDAERRPRRPDDATTRVGSLIPERAPPVRPRTTAADDVERVSPRVASREPVAESHQLRAPTAQRPPAPERAPGPPRAPATEPRPAQRDSRAHDAPPPAVRTTIVERIRTSSPATPKGETRVPQQSAVLLARAQTSALIRRERLAAAVPAPVQITIGRVEVRAVAGPSARAAAPGPAAPRLSLDEYLRQRSGDAR